MTIRQRIQDCFIIDLRAMAIFRIAIAFCIIADLISRFSYINLFQTSNGVLPVGNLGFTKYLPHFWSDSYSFQLLLFGVAILFALALLIGWKTKVSTIISWLLLVSLHSKLWITLDGADELLRAVMFWSIFLPLGAYFSVDSKKNKERKTQYSSISGVALLLLFVFYYFSAGVAKLNDAWLEGSALEIILRQKMWLRPVGDFLSQFPVFLKVLTPAIVIFELVGPFALLIPKQFSKIRIAAISAFIFFQISLGLCLELNLMPWIATAVLFIFLPTSFFNQQKGNELYVSSNRLKKIILIPLVIYVFGGFFIQKANISLPLYSKAYTLGLLSTWSFYSLPPTEDYTYAVTAELDNGKSIELISSSKTFTALFQNYRFKYYLETITYKNSTYGNPLLKWMIDNWEDENYSVKIVSAQLNCTAQNIRIEEGEKYDFVITEIN